MLILYAEDNFDDFNFFEDAVRTINPIALCVHVHNGLEALEFLSKTKAIPDIIFLDIAMLEMDGKSCLKSIRLVSALKSVPVIMFSTSRDKRDEEHCLQLGANGYLQKPRTMTEAVEKLRGFINGKV